MLNSENIPRQQWSYYWNNNCGSGGTSWANDIVENNLGYQSR